MGYQKKKAPCTTPGRGRSVHEGRAGEGCLVLACIGNFAPPFLTS